MTIRSLINAISQQEDINFLLTNRIPRATLTRFMGWFSKREQPLVRDASLAVLKLFTELDLSDARKARFSSLHDCFTRELKPGSRPFDTNPAVVASPCDAIVGAHGAIEDGKLFQIKGAPYSLVDLLGDATAAGANSRGKFVTLRLTAGMYHRFHAPHDLRIDRVRTIFGDCWNVNPIALKRVQELFCKNERVVINGRLGSGENLTLIAVAAILVASVRLHFLDLPARAAEPGARLFGCDVGVAKGEELGWFEHGSTIILLAPSAFDFAESIEDGRRIRAGQPLMRSAQVAAASAPAEPIPRVIAQSLDSAS
jgi:phosphatidylserine decarboxylase